jgi:hypothetical protein
MLTYSNNLFILILELPFYLLTCLLTQLQIYIVATLALGSRPKQRLARLRAKSELESHISCSRECKRVWGNEPSHSRVNSHFGSWSLNIFLNFQRMIAGVKSHWIETFLISLESYWNVNVWNGIAWPIWTSKTQVMAKRRVGSQVDNLTPNH